MPVGLASAVLDDLAAFPAHGFIGLWREDVLTAALLCDYLESLWNEKDTVAHTSNRCKCGCAAMRFKTAETTMKPFRVHRPVRSRHGQWSSTGSNQKRNTHPIAVGSDGRCQSLETSYFIRSDSLK